MKRIPLGLLIGLALILAGCGPVMSLFALYNETDVISDDSVVGQWAQQEAKGESNKNPMEEKECCWKIEKSDKGSYAISISSVKDSPHHVRIEMRIFKLDGKLFVDAETPNLDEEKDKFTVIPFPILTAHFFGRIWIEKDHIKMKLLDQDWFRDSVLRKRNHLDYVYTKDGLLLTASTEELQKFAIEFADDKDVFADEYDLVRKK